jgi:hypothetical protein
MKRAFVLISLLPVVLWGNETCVAPPEALSKLKGYFTYELMSNREHPVVLKFTYGAVGSDAVFRRSDVPKPYDPSRSFVYVYREGQPILTTSCRADSSWSQCAEESVAFIATSVMPQTPTTNPNLPIKGGCDLSMTVEAWRPSPDNATKRRLAAELLKEVTDRWGSDIETVYVGDFNVDDPDLLFDVIDAEGRDNLQGCFFDASRQPHCGWHMFGQSPVESLKRSIMKSPYKLFPPGTPPPDR